MAGEILTYPTDLKVHGRAICISPLGISVDDRFSKGKQKRLKYIFLPIPAGLRTAYSANWNQEKLGILGGQALEQIKNKQLDLKALAGSAGASIMKNLGAMASSYIDLDVGGLTSYATRGLINPNYALIFSGSNFRTFNFSYRLIARNKSESDTIRQIVKELKYHMSPAKEGIKTSDLVNSVGNEARNIFGQNFGNKIEEGARQVASNFLQYPNLFRLDFITENISRSQTLAGLNASASGKLISGNKNEYLFQPGICALRGLEIDYGTEGAPAFFKETGAPVTVSIGMSFIETEIITKESILQERGPS